MKRILAIVLSVLLLQSLFLNAFAAEVNVSDISPSIVTYGAGGLGGTALISNKTGTVKENDTLEFQAIPYRDFSKFLGWFDDNGTLYSYNKNIQVTYHSKTFKPLEARFNATRQNILEDGMFENTAAGTNVASKNDYHWINTSVNKISTVDINAYGFTKSAYGNATVTNEHALDGKKSLRLQSPGHIVYKKAAVEKNTNYVFGYYYYQKGDISLITFNTNYYVWGIDERATKLAIYNTNRLMDTDGGSNAGADSNEVYYKQHAIATTCTVDTLGDNGVLDSWTYCEFSFNSGNYNTVLLPFYSKADSIECYIDEVSLYPYSTVLPEKQVDPILESKTNTSVKLKSVSGYQYRMDDGAWQSSPLFTGLTPGSTHVFYQKLAIYGIVETSPLTVTLDKISGPSAPSAPKIASQSGNVVILEYTEGQEYKIQGGDWKTYPVFSGLSPNTSYNFYCRIAETATTNASAASAALSIKTANSASGSHESEAGVFDMDEDGYLTYSISEMAGKYKTYGRTYIDSNELFVGYSASGIEFRTYSFGDIIVNFDVKRVVDSYGGTCFFAVYVDGILQSRSSLILKGKGNCSMVVATDLELGMHDIKIIRKSELEVANVFVSSVAVCGFISDKPEDKPVKIEFLGDNITTGYGVLKEGNTSSNRFVYSQDATKTYAYKTAERLNADISIIARQGIGAYIGTQNYNMNAIYPYTAYYYNKNLLYDFNYSPDIVVINLGTIDMQTYASKSVTLEQLKTGFSELLSTVRQHNEDAYIIWAYGMMTNEADDIIKSVIADAGGEAEKYYSVKLPKNTNGDYGYPDEAGQAQAADALVEFIREKRLINNSSADIVLNPSKPDSPPFYTEFPNITLQSLSGKDIVYKMWVGSETPNDYTPYSGSIPKYSQVGKYNILACTVDNYGNYSTDVYASFNYYPLLDAPDIPEAVTVTDNSVVLKKTTGYEYKMGDGSWQDSPEFIGLNPVTQYDFYQRIKAAETHPCSKTSEKLSIATLKTTPKAPSEPKVSIVEQNRVVLEAKDGLEYRIDDGEWQQSPEFTRLTMATAYTFYQRYAETETASASPSSEGLIVLTNKGHVSAPKSPEILNILPNGVELVKVSGNQYKMDDGAWQDSNIFYVNGGVHSFYQRKSETEKFYASEASDALTLDLNYIRLKATDDSCAVAQKAKIAVSIENNEGFGTLSFIMRFDKSVLQLTNVIKNDISLPDNYKDVHIDSTITSANNNGWYKYGFAPDIINEGEFSDPVKYNGEIVVFEFKVLDSADAGDELEIVIEPFCCYRDDEQETDINLLGCTAKILVTDYLPGDINGDGIVDDKDVSTLSKYLAGWSVSVIEAALDCNGDGNIDDKDTSTLAKHLAGWSNTELH